MAALPVIRMVQSAISNGRKFPGLASCIVENASAARTVVKNLKAGVYQFQLRVIDNAGLSANDTVQVIVNSQVSISYSCTNSNRPLVKHNLSRSAHFHRRDCGWEWPHQLIKLFLPGDIQMGNLDLLHWWIFMISIAKSGQLQN